VASWNNESLNESQSSQAASSSSEKKTTEIYCVFLLTVKMACSQDLNIPRPSIWITNRFIKLRKTNHRKLRCVFFDHKQLYCSKYSKGGEVPATSRKHELEEKAVIEKTDEKVSTSRHHDKLIFTMLHRVTKELGHNTQCLTLKKTPKEKFS